MAINTESILWPTFQDVLKAYGECRVGKPASSHQTRFEYQLGKNLCDLTRDLQRGTYKPLRSVCFVVTHPKPREIFAAHFRDRIVHHLIVSKLSRIWERKLSPFSYACRKGRGTHGALAEIQRQIRRLSQGGRHDVYALQLDVASFFVTIHRPTMKRLMLEHVKDEKLRWLIDVSCTHDARKGALLQSPHSLHDLIPKEKSWFARSADEGIPIGNLTSQFGANLYLNELDHWIVRTLKPKGYLRYMDDFTLLDTDPNRLMSLENPIDNWLREHRKQSLNRHKTTLTRIRDGIEYLGYKIRQVDSAANPAKLFMPPKKKWEFIKDLRLLEKEGLPPPEKQHFLALGHSRSKAQKRLASINSRLGYQKHAATFQFRKVALEGFIKMTSDDSHLPREHSLPWENIRVKKNWGSVKLK